jgi:hypothetical protein
VKVVPTAFQSGVFLFLLFFFDYLLDVIFKENNQAKRNQTAVENTNRIEKLANTLLDQEEPFRKSKNRKRLKAFADNTYRNYFLKFKSEYPVSRLEMLKLLCIESGVQINIFVAYNR